MYNTTHTHEATNTVESTTMGTAIVSHVYTVDTDENGELVQAEAELVEITTLNGEPIKRLWGYIHAIQQLRADGIAEIVAEAKAEIHAERVAAAEAEGIEETPEGQLTIELAAFGVAL